MIDMAEKLAEKTAQIPHAKKQNSRLTLKEKIEVCTLLGSGNSLDETAQLISKKTGKKVSKWMIRHYLDNPKWAPHIQAARRDDLLHAEKLPTFSTTGRVRKYNRLLEVFEKKFQESVSSIDQANLDPESDPGVFKIFTLTASYMLKILREVREEEYEALENKSAGSESEIDDFFILVEKRVIASRRRRDPDRELEKAAGLI
ncbi:hypothetical protein ES707_18569 [subsurface metagenome]